MKDLAGPNIRKKELDVTSEESVDHTIREVLSEAGKIDILVSKRPSTRSMKETQ